MKKSLMVLGLVVALMVPASLAVAQSDDAPVAKQTRLGDGSFEDCPYFIEKGEPQMLRQQDGVQTQAGARWGDGPMGSDEAPLQREGFGPGECVGDCEGDGPYGPFGPRAEDAPYGPLGDQDGDGASYGPGEAGYGAGPQDGTGPIQEGPQDGTGNQFGPGPGGDTTASPGGSANQHGAGPGGNK